MSDKARDKRYVVLGAGPAGMGAAWELHKQGVKDIVVIDKNDRVGGLSRTAEFHGYLFDMGPHRFLTKYEEVEHLWREILGKDLLERPRRTRLYYSGRFFKYPLKLPNALWNLGLIESTLAGLSFVKAQIDWRGKDPQNFAEWTTKTFGDRISRIFFRDYTKKVWGINASEVGVDWAGQRIKPLRLKDFYGDRLKRLFSQKVEDIGAQFLYPRRGAGMFYEKMQEQLEKAGVRFMLKSSVMEVQTEGSRIVSINIKNSKGESESVSGDIFLSSIPSNLLIKSMQPQVSAEVIEHTKAMRFRAHIAVNMIVKRKDMFPDSWLYIQSTAVRIARIGNYGVFSPDMLADPNSSAIGIELFCFAGDEFWRKSDEEIIEQTLSEMIQLGFMKLDQFGGAFVVRHEDAYPTHYIGFKQEFARLREFLEKYSNLRLIGRAGMYKYKDQDHALYTGMLTVRNLFGEHNDVWQLGEEQEFFEDRTVPSGSKK